MLGAVCRWHLNADVGFGCLAGLLACQGIGTRDWMRDWMRDRDWIQHSGMQNEPLVFDGVRQDGSHYQIEEHGLYLLLPFDYTPEQVKEQINLFGVNASKLIAMQAYDALHNSPNTALRQNVKPVSGGYWSMLQIAFDSELKIIVEDTLDNMFLDQEIYTLMGALFNIFDHPKDYGNSDLINFAYGRVTAFDGKN